MVLTAVVKLVATVIILQVSTPVSTGGYSGKTMKPVNKQVGSSKALC